MFLENDYARPLFDFENGGVAKAFQCLMSVKVGLWIGQCNKVTRTERGMRMHLKTVHNWQEQPCLYSTESQNEPNSGVPRKLRAGRPIFQRQEESATPELMEKIPASQKLTETNEGESHKPTREEK